jgi:hypothetical protein
LRTHASRGGWFSGWLRVLFVLFLLLAWFFALTGLPFAGGLVHCLSLRPYFLR